ncbi:MAG TPA: hypothetical protein DIW27_10595 [Cytophagales bacterium]|nr:hypothetical protein [Cytophagales bacterium]
MSEEIINKVARSPLQTIDLEELYVPGQRVTLDIKDQLFQEMILKEKDFRDFIKSNDWSIYKGKHVAIHCSADAIVPTWAYMLLAVALKPFATTIIFGSLEEMEAQLFKAKLDSIDWSVYQNGKVVIKGCSKVNVPVAVYVDVTSRLQPIASSIMFGEPCSTVPIFKKPKV